MNRLARFSAIGVSLSLLVLASACGKTGTGKADTSLMQKPFSTAFIMETGELSAEGTITRVTDDIWNVSFSSPDTVAGVVLDFHDDEVKASYKGLEFSVPQAAMPAKALLMRFMDAAEKLADEEEITCSRKDDMTEIEGELDGEPYILYLNRDGSPKEFLVNNMGGSMKFRDFSGDVAVTTTTTTIERLVVTTTETAAG